VHAFGWLFDPLSQGLKANGGIDKITQDQFCGVVLAVDEQCDRLIEQGMGEGWVCCNAAPNL